MERQRQTGRDRDTERQRETELDWVQWVSRIGEDSAGYGAPRVRACCQKASVRFCQYAVGGERVCGGEWTGVWDWERGARWEDRCRGPGSGPPAVQGGLGLGWRGRLAEVGTEIREGAYRCPWFGGGLGELRNVKGLWVCEKSSICSGHTPHCWTLRSKCAGVCVQECCIENKFVGALISRGAVERNLPHPSDLSEAAFSSKFPTTFLLSWYVLPHLWGLEQKWELPTQSWRRPFTLGDTCLHTNKTFLSTLTIKRLNGSCKSLIYLRPLGLGVLIWFVGVSQHLQMSKGFPVALLSLWGHPGDLLVETFFEILLGLWEIYF